MSIESIKKSIVFMLKMETGARDLYKEYIRNFKNPDLISDLKRIEKQEELHMVMAKRLMEIVEAKE